ncbi:hypothetical protein OVA29_01705 [Exiguobacterium sp. SL14]|nr:hypothetical protein [Exiguobacterium sp. SL14]
MPLTEKQLAPRTLAYKQVGDRTLQLDLYYPRGKDRFQSQSTRTVEHSFVERARTCSALAQSLIAYLNSE